MTRTKLSVMNKADVLKSGWTISAHTLGFDHIRPFCACYIFSEVDLHQKLFYCFVLSTTSIQILMKK